MLSDQLRGLGAEDLRTVFSWEEGTVGRSHLERRILILVPFVGACVHVPPPPANQLVLVTTERPYASKSMFEPVHVTGMLGTAYATTELAAVGYAMSADRIEPYS